MRNSKTYILVAGQTIYELMAVCEQLLLPLIGRGRVKPKSALLYGFHLVGDRYVDPCGTRCLNRMRVLGGDLVAGSDEIPEDPGRMLHVGR